MANEKVNVSASELAGGKIINATTTVTPEQQKKDQDSIKKTETKIKTQKEQDEYAENLEKLRYYMSIASPVIEPVKYKKMVKKVDDDGKVVLDSDKKPVRIEQEFESMQPVGFNYYNISDESTGNVSTPIEQWIQDKFGGNITLDKKTNTIEVKGQVEEKEGDIKK